MKIPPRFVPLAILAFAAAFTACDRQDALATASGTESTASGAVAFRLADTLLSVVAKTSDSVRIEAVRAGFDTRIATGSIGGNTVLSGLDAGAWTLKVATFDTLQAVSWYGEAVVQILSGKTVEAVVVLRRASGSVNVHIVLDSVPHVVDTTRWTVTPSTGSLPGYLPILRSWRSDSGIHILTSLYCLGVVVRVLPDSGTVLRFGYDPDLKIKCVAGSPAPVLVFVPWKNCGNVTLLDANGKETFLPLAPCHPPLPGAKELDTLAVKLLETNPATYLSFPVESAWRDDKGIYIATSYDETQLPVVAHSPAQSSLPRRLVLVGMYTTDVLFGVRRHIVFVPFPADEDAIVSDLAGDSVFKLPGKPMIVDPPPPSVPDTVTVPYAMGDLAAYEPLPVERAWRTDSGLYIATRYDYFQPVVVATPTQTMFPGVVTLVGKPIKTVAAVPLAPHVVFVPFPSAWGVSIANLLNDSVVKLPGKPVVVDPPSTVDTVTVEWIEGAPADHEPLPLERAWRTDAGIFIATRYDYFVPAVFHNLMQSSLPRRLYLVGTPINTFTAVKLLPHIVFVPFPAAEDVIVSNLANDTVFKLPGKRVVAEDSSFVKYSLARKDPLSGEAEYIVLTSNGDLVRTTINNLVDSGPLVQTRVLNQDTLARIRSILERSSTRHPGGLPAITAANCPSDAPIHSRVIDYADGTGSSMNWSLSSYCGEFPASWTALDPVDAILRGSFAVE